jgi:hypothetical protein
VYGYGDERCGVDDARDSAADGGQRL